MRLSMSTAAVSLCENNWLLFATLHFCWKTTFPFSIANASSVKGDSLAFSYVLLSSDGDAISTTRFGSSKIEEFIPGTLSLRPVGGAVSCSLRQSRLFNQAAELFISFSPWRLKAKGRDSVMVTIGRWGEPESVLQRFQIYLRIKWNVRTLRSAASVWSFWAYISGIS